MKGVRTTVFLCVALALALVAVPALAHHARYASRVSIHEPDPNHYTGRVYSQLDACVRNRLVNVYLDQAGTNDPLVGSTKTDSTGHWDLGPPGSNYYAKVTRKVLTPGSHRHVCLPDTSPTI